MRTALALALAPLVLLTSAHAQWDDTQRIGTGGETYVSTDGKGTVWISSHLPVQALVSRDWGATFGEPKAFPDSLGDMVVFARPNGKAVVTYMYPFNTQGMATWKATDYGAKWEQGEGIQHRPLDREWPTVDEKTGTVYMVYSDGYIGGPKSKGVFLARSDDEGLTWKEVGRVDKEAQGDYPVDPHLVSSSDGKLYALWTTSKDYNTIDTYKFAVSSDGGKTWTSHTTLSAVNKLPGADVQERWMLGGLAAYKENEVVAFYMDYKPLTVSGETMNCLLVHTRSSHDGGKTWGEPRTAMADEVNRAAFNFKKKRLAMENFPTYMQCLPWASFDAKGRLHLVCQDNREGQGTVDGKAYGRWHVRHAESPKNGEPFLPSEAVSKSVTCVRPPLDFICCAADSKYVYVTWTESPGKTQGWEFSGEFWFGRKKLD